MALYWSEVVVFAPHQNQFPVCSWKGRKMSGISSFDNSLANAAMLSNHLLKAEFFSPPGKICSTTFPVVSLKFPPVTKLYGCILKVTIPPNSCAAFIDCAKFLILFSLSPETPGFS